MGRQGLFELNWTGVQYNNKSMPCRVTPPREDRRKEGGEQGRKRQEKVKEGKTTRKGRGRREKRKGRATYLNSTLFIVSV